VAIPLGEWVRVGVVCVCVCVVVVVVMGWGWGEVNNLNQLWCKARASWAWLVDCEVNNSRSLPLACLVC